jgi:hypothetical protein
VVGKLKRLSVAVTPELASVLDQARGCRYFGPWLEELLWSLPRLQKIAREQKIERVRRPQRGKWKLYKEPRNDDGTTKRTSKARRK